MPKPQQTDANLNLANPKQAVVGTAAVPAATLYGVYAEAGYELLRALRVDGGAISKAGWGDLNWGSVDPQGQRSSQVTYVEFEKLGPEGASGAVRSSWRIAGEGEGSSSTRFSVTAEAVDRVLEHVTFIETPPTLQAPAPTPITPVQARARSTGVGAFFRAYKWPILGGAGVLALGAAWFFSERSER